VRLFVSWLGTYSSNWMTFGGFLVLFLFLIGEGISVLDVYFVFLIPSPALARWYWFRV
jgi:hypothetical protein